MAKKKNISTVKLVAGHAIIIGHRPISLSHAQITDKLEKEGQDFARFGLFDNSTPNYTNYYPEVTAEDLHPKDEEFIEPVFRLLSNVAVHSRFNPIYFPADVLKKSMYKLIGQTINIDHETAVGNAIGTVKSVEWQNSYTKDGIKVPAGINGTLKIDGKSNPRIARGIMMEPPSIHSESVTVSFAWEKSHPNLSDEEFYQKLGTFDDKGNPIQKVVTEVQAYHEISLVGHGADPYAQKVGKDGKIINPLYAGIRTGQVSNSEEGNNILVFDWKDLNSSCNTKYNETIMNTYFDDNLTDDNEQIKTEMKDILRLIELTLGLEVNSLTEENYKEKMESFKATYSDLVLKANKTDEPVKILNLEGVQNIEKEISDLRAFKQSVPENLSEIQSLAQVATTVITSLKEDTKRLYKLSLGDKGTEDANIIALIDSANFDSLNSLHKQYDQSTEGMFNFECQDCHSHNVTRASAKPSKEDNSFTHKSTGELIDTFTKVTVKKGFLEK